MAIVGVLAYVLRGVINLLNSGHLITGFGPFVGLATRRNAVFGRNLLACRIGVRSVWIGWRASA
jgi:hypothetical protein